MGKLSEDNKGDEISRNKEKLNPFPGPRPFNIDDSHLFFGREGQSSEILAKLAENRFIAVLGASGIGKSSLIASGLVPLLYAGFIPEVGADWQVVSFRPGVTPIENLADALISTALLKEPDEETKSLYCAMLRRSSMGLVDTLKHLHNEYNPGTLIFIDQFEELFRNNVARKDQELSKESDAFVKLLVEAVGQTAKPIYVVLNMRSDFMGECSIYKELTKYMNRSNYLVPQLTRNDYKEAITGPLSIVGTPIDPALVEELLNEIDDKPDQLAIFQHAMMRLWDHWATSKDHSHPISVADYKAIGKMEIALSAHANEIFESLKEPEQHICELLFKAITEKRNNKGFIRRPTTIEEISKIAQARVDDIILVVNKFRGAGKSFLTPTIDVTLKPSTVIDLSNESIMRIWDRLAEWVEEEFQSVQIYLHLAEASAAYQQGRGSLWVPPDLQIALTWEKNQKPTLAWAQRYNPAFQRTILFLQTSAKEYKSEEMGKIQKQKRTLKRSQLIALLLFVVAIILLVLWFSTRKKGLEAEKQSKEAETNSMIAKMQKEYAEKTAKEAFEQKKMAYSLTKEAYKQKDLATQQSMQANLDAQQAMMQREIANRNSNEATNQANQAKSNVKEVLEQKSAADKEREAILKKRMLAISLALATKSQQITDDKDLKALLAYFAFSYNERNLGPSNNSDIYASLYQSLLLQYGRGYNTFRGHSETVNAVIFDPVAPYFYSTGSDGKVIRWDITDSTHRPSIILNNKVVNKSIDISPNGNLLALGTTGSGLGILDIKSGSAPFYYTNLGRKIESVAFSNDGKSVIACGDSTLIEFNVSSKTGVIAGFADADIFSVDISPDGKLVAAGTRSGKVYIWNRANGYKKELLSDEPNSQIQAVRFNHRGDLLAVGNVSGYLKTWDIRNRKLLSNIKGHGARITCICFSPNDKLLATSSYDANILLWDATNIYLQPIKLKDHKGWVTSVAFNPFGNRIISGSSKDEKLILWHTNVYEIASLVLKKIHRNFSQEEWNTYIGSDIPFEKVK